MTVRTNEKPEGMGLKTSERKQVFLAIPANWDNLTPAEKKQAAEAMAGALQRRLCITDKSEQTGDPPANPPTGSEQP